jgi:hypothetical protein
LLRNFRPFFLLLPRLSNLTYLEANRHLQPPHVFLPSLTTFSHLGNLNTLHLISELLLTHPDFKSFSDASQDLHSSLYPLQHLSGTNCSSLLPNAHFLVFRHFLAYLETFKPNLVVDDKVCMDDLWKIWSSIKALIRINHSSQ